MLEGWAAGNYDRFADSLDQIINPGNEVVGLLREHEGDARGMMDDIEDEIDRLGNLVRGALYIARQAIDMVVDPQAPAPSTRNEVLQLIRDVPE